MGQNGIYCICGVSGCGKSALGIALARELRIQFIDGDDYHTDVNKDKLRKGIPLSDSDRMPWLKEIHEKLLSNKSCVVACSALKKKYREYLATDLEGKVIFIYSKVDFDIVKERVSKRRGHFVGVNLVESQFATLESPKIDESVSYKVIEIENHGSIKDFIQQAKEKLLLTSQ
eukprot:NODE_88_length_21789_cov_0.534440.p14 type:complete len:173 gc:universal NODE_88_length_21789_cov_0.534440:5686-6204(+)